jgi:hypothetical chaperone protein
MQLKLQALKKYVCNWNPSAQRTIRIDVTKNKTVLVFDFGGGTLDLSIVRFPQKEIIINSGIPLGGDLINSNFFYEKIAHYLGKGGKYGNKNMTIPDALYLKMKNWYAISLMKNSDFYGSIDQFSYMNSDPKKVRDLEMLVSYNLGFKLYEEIDRLKKALSFQQENTFSLPLPNSEIIEMVQRHELEEIIKNDLLDIHKLIETTLKNAGLTTDQIDEIVITGGSSLIPSVINILSENFGSNKLSNRDTFTSVAAGLALYALEEYLNNNIQKEV